MIKATREQLDQMKAVKEEATKVAMRFRQNTEVGIIIGGFAQVMLSLLRLYPKHTKEELTTGLVAFLREDNMEAVDSPSIIIPKGIM